MYSAFSSPATGGYDIAALNNFLLSAQGNADAEAVWALLNEQAVIERESAKYGALAAAGAYANSLEVAKGVEAANKSFNGRWAVKNYSKIADSLVAVPQSEVRAQYDANKLRYKRQPTRTITYASFPIAPSAADLAKIQSEVESISESLNSAGDVRAFVRESRGGVISQNYMSRAAPRSRERGSCSG